MSPSPHQHVYPTISILIIYAIVVGITAIVLLVTGIRWRARRIVRSAERETRRARKRRGR